MPILSFLRVAAAVPELRVADCRFNAERTLDLLRDAEERGVRVVVFPECGLTGYTCHDLFHHPTLLRSAENALETLLSSNKEVAGEPGLALQRVFQRCIGADAFLCCKQDANNPNVVHAMRQEVQAELHRLFGDSVRDALDPRSSQG